MSEPNLGFKKWYGSIWGAGIGAVAAFLLVSFFGLFTTSRDMVVASFVAAAIGLVIGWAISWYYARRQPRYR